MIPPTVDREVFERVAKRLAEHGADLYVGWQSGLKMLDGAIRESCYGVANIPELAHRVERETARMAAIVAIRRMRDLLNDVALSVEPHNPDRHARLIARRDGLDAILCEFDTLWPAEVSP